MIESGYVVIIMIMLVIFSLGMWIPISQRRTKAALRKKGIRTFATVRDVRDDRSDLQTIIRYEFVDSTSGQIFCRSGVLQRNLPFPGEGDKIEIIYLPRNPKVSRLVFEENFFNV